MRKHPVPGARELALGLKILFEDREIIVVDKPAGLLTMGTERDKIHTAYFVLSDYVRKGQARSRARIFIVHRLDRDTSGVLVFAKTEQAKARLQGAWDNVEKTYLAVVHGRVPKDSDTITSYLIENASYVVYETADATLGKLAKTAYKVIGRSADRSLLEVNLMTGRKHQIRVHMASIGHPIVGDDRNPRLAHLKPRGRDLFAGRMALHSWSITFPHPFSGEVMTFKTEVPREFLSGFPHATPGGRTKSGTGDEPTDA